MITKFLKFSGSLLILLTCAGCLKSPLQRPKNLKPLTKETSHDSQTKEQVTVYAKKLDMNDQTEMFGKYARQQLQKYHVVPIQVTIENQSATAWVLADINITLNKLTIDEVNAKLFASRRWIPLRIFLGGAACALICGPLTSALLLYCNVEICGALWLAGWTATAIVTATFCIASGYAISNHISRKQMCEYFKTCCNAEGLTLNKEICASMVFFVEESQLPDKLNLLLTDKDREKHALPFELAI